MKKYFMLVLPAFIISCMQEAPKVKQVTKMNPGTELKGIEVVNDLDPICQMKTAEYLKDTVVYNGKTYGFCSDYCKKEFKKNPLKYAQEN